MVKEKSEVTFPWERAFASNMEMLRKSQNLSQNELAKRLSERGLNFHQATVQRVETQERSVRLDEAHVISSVLGSTLEQMTKSSSQDLQELLSVAREAGDFAMEVVKANDAFLKRAYGYGRKVYLLESRLEASLTASKEHLSWTKEWDRILGAFSRDLSDLQHRAAELGSLRLGVVGGPSESTEDLSTEKAPSRE